MVKALKMGVCNTIECLWQTQQAQSLRPKNLVFSVRNFEFRSRFTILTLMQARLNKARLQ